MSDKRLIDADELKKQAYESIEWDSGGFHQMVVDVYDIDNAPTVDAVQVVRCKDCRYAKDYYNVDYYKKGDDDHGCLFRGYNAIQRGNCDG